MTNSPAENHKLKLTFAGGAGSVTGANFLLESPQSKILIDCGLTQGGKIFMEKNREPFSYNPSEINVLLVTHAHIDHIGRIPKLYKDGFRGVILSTPATKSISEVMLLDSLGVLGKEAAEEGQEPIYGERDIEGAVSLWQTENYHRARKITPDFEVYFKDAGHILGSAIVELRYAGKKIVFTGDLGNSPAPILRDAEDAPDADYLVMESVYGDKEHESKEDRRRHLQNIISDAARRGGAIMVPAFSLERTQEMLHELNHLSEEKKIPRIPIFIDSPLAIKVTDIYKKRNEFFKKDVRDEIAAGDDIFDFPGLVMTEKTEESRAIKNSPNPKLIIAGSGMSNGGRILRHEAEYLPDPKSTLLIVGFQAPGSLGRQLADGAEKVMINGEEVPVRAKVEIIYSYSSHKDSRGLVDFAGKAAGGVKKIFVVMGEPKASLFLVQRLRDYLGVDAVAPQEGDSFTLEM